MTLEEELKLELRNLNKMKDSLIVVQQTLLHPYIYPDNFEELKMVNKEIYIIREKISNIKQKLFELNYKR